MTKLSLSEYKQLGESIRESTKHLRLISKLLQKGNLDSSDLHLEGNFFDKIVMINCELSNLSRSLDEELDLDYSDNIIETITYFS